MKDWAGWGGGFLGADRVKWGCKVAIHDLALAMFSD